MDPVSIDRLLAIAERAVSQGKSTWIHLPDTVKLPLAVRKRRPQESHRNGRTFVYLDPCTADVDHALRALAAARPQSLVSAAHR